MFRSFAIGLFALVITAVSAPFCAAQSETSKTELGVIGGFGKAATSMTATADGSSASAGIQPGPIVGAFLGMNPTNHIGGEIRYEMNWDTLRVSQGGTSASLDGRSQLVHYDLLWHATGRSSPVRPFLAAGGGIRWIEGTGAQQAYQPLSTFALLTPTRELLPLISAGGGIKFKISPRVSLRVEVRDFMSPPLKKVIAAPPGATLSGWINDFAAMAGLTFNF